MTRLTVLGAGLSPTELKNRIDRNLNSIAEAVEAVRLDLDALAAAASSPAAASEVTRRLLTVEQAAAALGMGRSTVEQLIRVGKLGSIKIESSRRIPVEDIDAFIRARRDGQQSA